MALERVLFRINYERSFALGIEVETPQAQRVPIGIGIAAYSPTRRGTPKSITN
jgi:hypothetical protein